MATQLAHWLTVHHSSVAGASNMIGHVRRPLPPYDSGIGLLTCTQTLSWRPHGNITETTMWANAQRDGRPAEYRWRPLFNDAKFVPSSNAAKTPNPLKFAGVPQTNETISAASGPKFTILSGRVEEILLLNKFFSFGDFFASCICSEPRAAHFRFSF